MYVGEPLTSISATGWSMDGNLDKSPQCAPNIQGCPFLLLVNWQSVKHVSHFIFDSPPINKMRSLFFQGGSSNCTLFHSFLF